MLNNIINKLTLKTFKIIRILLSYYLISNFYVSYAVDDKKINSNSNTSWLNMIRLQNTTSWKEFMTKKELNDINYDLYRMRSFDINDRVSLAQDPKGYFINKHNSMFCFPQIDKTCKSSSSLYVYGDIKTNILLENIYKDPEQINIASEVIRNIVNPFPSNIALEMLEASDVEKELPSNKAALAENYAAQARLGVVRNSFNTMLLNRLPLDYIARSDESSDNKIKASKLSIMEEQVNNRFANSAWQNLIEKGNNEALFKELIKMLAFDMWMGFEKYKQEERIETLLATLVAQQETTNNLLMQNNVKKP